MIGFACRSHGARCTRATAFSIHVWSALLVAPAVAAAQTPATYLAIGSDAGDSIGRGQPALVEAGGLYSPRPRTRRSVSASTVLISACPHCSSTRCPSLHHRRAAEHR